MTALAPIAVILVNTYDGLTATTTTLILMILTIMYIPCSFPANFSVD